MANGCSWVHLQAVLLEAIEDAGFEGESLQEADSNTVTLQVEGMTCSSCSSAVENAVAGQKGVISAAVNLLAKKAEVGLALYASGSCHKQCEGARVITTPVCYDHQCSTALNDVGMSAASALPCVLERQKCVLTHFGIGCK